MGLSNYKHVLNLLYNEKIVSSFKDSDYYKDRIDITIHGHAKYHDYLRNYAWCSPDVIGIYKKDIPMALFPLICAIVKDEIECTIKQSYEEVPPGIIQPEELQTILEFHNKHKKDVLTVGDVSFGRIWRSGHLDHISTCFRLIYKFKDVYSPEDVYRAIKIIYFYRVKWLWVHENYTKADYLKKGILNTKYSTLFNTDEVKILTEIWKYSKEYPIVYKDEETKLEVFCYSIMRLACKVFSNSIGIL